MVELLGERQCVVLNAVVARHIRTARPVSSADIAAELDLDISPATVRSDMLQLDETGYLDQPHTSAGRVPTDRGYRFFVDHMNEAYPLEARERALIDRVFASRETDEFIHELPQAVARVAKTFVTAGFFNDHRSYAAGFEEMFDEPEFDDTEYVRTFGRLADRLDNGLGAMIRALDRDLDDEIMRIYIGDENPYHAARAYAMIATSWRRSDGERGYLVFIGPKRTNYPKHKAIVDNIRAKKRATHG